jgi:transaldolase
MPEPTLNAVRDTGLFKGDTATNNYELAGKVLSDLDDLGIDILEVAEKLESEGIEKFIKPWLELIDAVEVAAVQ